MTMDNNALASLCLTDLTEDLVIEYLRANPEFFQAHEDLLENLYIPHDCKGATSLIERQVALLRKKNIELEDELQTIIEIARDNESLYDATTDLTLGLMQAPTLIDVINRIEQAICCDFRLDVFKIGLVNCDNLEHIGTSNELIFPMGKSTHPIFRDTLRTQTTSCKPFTKALSEKFFGPLEFPIRSCAIIPLLLMDAPGVLMIGSQDKNHFHRDMDTTFLDYIGFVLGLRIEQTR